MKESKSNAKLRALTDYYEYLNSTLGLAVTGKAINDSSKYLLDVKAGQLFEAS